MLEIMIGTQGGEGRGGEGRTGEREKSLKSVAQTKYSTEMLFL